MKRFLSLTKNLWLLAVLTLMVTPVFGQAIFTNPITGTDAGLVNPYVAGQVVDPNLVVSGIGHGTGVTGVASTNNYSANGWNSVDFANAAVGNDYFEWIMTPDAENVINFQSLLISLSRNNLDFGSNVVLRTSVDAFASDIHQFVFVNNTLIETVPLNAAMFQNVSGPIAFRIYAWGAPANRILRVNSFTFSGSTPGIFYNPITGVNPGQTNPYAVGQLTNSNLSSVGISRGLGVIGNNGNDAYVVRGWDVPTLDDAIASDRFIEWTIVPNDGFEIDFKNLVVSLRVNNIELENNVVMRSSIDGYAADVASFPLITNVSTTFEVDLSAASYQNINTPITFRIYAWGASVATRNIRVNDFNFGGSVNVVPGPPLLATNAPSPVLFDSLVHGVASASQTVQVYGLNPSLGYPATVLVNAVPNIEVSSDNTTWGATTSLTLSSPAQVPLYIRMVPTYFGSQTFTSGINLSSTSFSSPISINVQGNVIVAAPVATAATNITTNSFDANWNPVAGAVSYNLNVGVWGTIQSLYQDFNTTLNNPGWTSLSCSRITGSTLLINPTGSARFNVDGSRMTTPSIQYPRQVSFFLKQVTTNTKEFVVKISTVSQVGPYSTILATYNQGSVPVNTNSLQTIDLSAYQNEPSVFIRFERVGGVANTDYWSIDDIDVTSGDLQAVPPYDNFDVGNVTTFTISGLTDFTDYVYSVNAVNNEQTENSNVIDVTTARLTVTWNGTDWSNVIGPDEDMDAIINGDYSTGLNSSFTANSLTVNPTYTLTINSGGEVVLSDAFVNNGTALNVIVESNGNLVQKAEAPINSGSITVRRDTQALMRLDYVAWSSPVIGQNLLSFSPQTVTNRFYTYNTLTNVYQTIDPTVNAFSGAKGYLIRLPNNHPTTPTIWTGEFSGIPNTGTINQTMVNNGTGFRFNLIGNPYASGIELSEFTTENNSAITGTLYFWRETNGSAGTAYVSYAGGIWSNASTDTDINVGQGFLVEALTGQTNVKFTNKMRSSTNGTSYKSAQEIQTEESNAIWLTLKKDNSSIAYLAVGYAIGATNSIENGKDAVAINDSEIALTSLVDATELAIQQRALPFVNTDEVALRFKTNVAGTYTISNNQLSGFFAGSQDVYLKDMLTNVTHNLKLEAYTFTTEAGIFDARFKIVYVNSTLGLDDVLISESQIVAYVNSKVLNIEAVNQTIDSVTVYDISGRMIAQKRNVNALNTELSLNGVASQVLLVQISTDKGTITKKIIF